MATKKTVEFYDIGDILESLSTTSKLTEECVDWIVAEFWDRLDTFSYGDAELTLIRGSWVATHLTEIASEYEDCFEEPCSVILPNDLKDTLVALDG